MEDANKDVTYVFNSPNIKVSYDLDSPTNKDELMALRRFVMRVCGDERAAPAELEAMVGVAELTMHYA